MSGVGGYVADIDEWGTNSTAAYFERNSIKITATFKENVSLYDSPSSEFESVLSSKEWVSDVNDECL